MAVSFAEVIGLGTPCTIAPIAAGRLLAMWWGLGNWMWAESTDAGASWTVPAIAFDGVTYPADASDNSDNLFLRGVAMTSTSDTVYICFRQWDPSVTKDDGASCKVRVAKAVYSAGWTFTAGPAITTGADNKRANNHSMLPDLAWDSTNSYLHVFTVREYGNPTASSHRVRMEAFNSSLTSQYSTTHDVGTRMTSISMASKGSKLAWVATHLDGTGQVSPSVLAGGASYTQFTTNNSALTNTRGIEVPVSAVEFEGGADDDVRIYTLAASGINTWLFSAAGPTLGTIDTKGTFPADTLDAGRSIADVIFAIASSATQPTLRVNADATLNDPNNDGSRADSKVRMPPASVLPVRTLARAVGPSSSGSFAKGVFVAVSDLVAGRLYFVEWDAVPLKPIDLSPPNGSTRSTGLVTLKARYRFQEESTGSLVFEVDDDINFGSINQTLTASTLSNDTMGTVTTALLAEGQWYWRVKGNVSGRGDGVYSDTGNFFVGAGLETIQPHDGEAKADDGAPPTSITLSAVVRVVSSGTARAEFEVANNEAFTLPTAANGGYVADGQTSSVAVSLANGIWYLRAKARTLAGTAGPFYRTQGFRVGRTGETRKTSVSQAPFRGIMSLPSVSERGSDVVNRVIVKVRNTAIEVIRETDPAPAANRVREVVDFMEAGTEAQASQRARDILESRSSTRKTLDGIQIPLTPDLTIERRVRVVGVAGWTDGAYPIQTIEHDIVNWTTSLTIGDFNPTEQQALLRIAQTLQRTRAEDRTD